MFRFSTRLSLRTTEVDRQLLATPVSLLGMFQEAAVRQAERLGRGPRWLHQKGQGWAIAHTRARFLAVPAWPGEVLVTTWASQMNRFLSRREFLIVDRSGQPLVAGSSLWAFMDMRNRKMIGIPREVREAYRVDPARAWDMTFTRPRAPARRPPLNRRIVGERHIDFNGHANNLDMLGWMLEPLPAEASYWHLREVNVRYQQEILRDQEIAICCEPAGPGQATGQWRHAIYRGDEQTPLAMAETTWQAAASGET